MIAADLPWFAGKTGSLFGGFAADKAVEGVVEGGVRWLDLDDSEAALGESPGRILQPFEGHPDMCS